VHQLSLQHLICKTLINTRINTIDLSAVPWCIMRGCIDVFSAGTAWAHLVSNAGSTVPLAVMCDAGASLQCGEASRREGTSRLGQAGGWGGAYVVSIRQSLCQASIGIAVQLDPICCVFWHCGHITVYSLTGSSCRPRLEMPTCDQPDVLECHVLVACGLGDCCPGSTMQAAMPTAMAH
jgi:hypothetical protein